MTSAPDRILYSMDEAAGMLGICRKTLLAEVTDGRIRYVKVRSRRRFAQCDIDEYLRRQRETAPCKSASGNAKVRRTSTTASRTTVCDFEAARGRVKEALRQRRLAESGTA